MRIEFNSREVGAALVRHLNGLSGSFEYQLLAPDKNPQATLAFPARYMHEALIQAAERRINGCVQRRPRGPVISQSDNGCSIEFEIEEHGSDE